MNFDFSAVRRLVQGTESRLASIRTEVQQLQTRREAVRHAAASREDVKSLVAGWIASNSNRFTGQVQEAVERMARNPTAMGKGSELRRLVTFGAADPAFAAGFGEEPADLAPVLSALFGPTMLASVSAAIDGMPWPETALSAGQRENELATLDTKLEKLLEEERALVDNARAAGLHLE